MQHPVKPKAVISGGSRGIGRAIALQFTNAGFDVAVYSRSADKLEALRAEILSIRSDAQPIMMAVDATDGAGVQAFAEAVMQQWGRVDVLVNNAGSFTPDNILTAPEGVLEHLMAANVTSAYQLTRALQSVLVQDGTGYVFNICSIASLQAYPASLYTITKHALLGFSRALRREWMGKVRVSSIMPGATYTDSWAGAGLPEERFMPADDVAALILHAYHMAPQTVVEELVIRPLEGDV